MILSSQIIMNKKDFDLRPTIQNTWDSRSFSLVLAFYKRMTAPPPTPPILILSHIYTIPYITPCKYFFYQNDRLYYPIHLRQQIYICLLSHNY